MGREAGQVGQVGHGFVLGPSSGLFGASETSVEGATVWGEKQGKWGKWVVLGPSSGLLGASAAGVEGAT